MIIVLIFIIPLGYFLIKGWIWLVNSIMNPMIERSKKRDSETQEKDQERFYDKKESEKEKSKEQVILDQLNMKRPNPITDKYVIFMRNRGVNIG